MWTMMLAAICLAPRGVWGIEGDALPRFAARLSNGERIEGHTLSGWDRQGGDAKLEGKPLWGDAPMQWLLDRRPAPPRAGTLGAHVEFRQGDILPGEVLGYIPPQDLPATPGHFLVTCDAQLQPPPSVNDSPVRAVARWVKRIVLEPSAGAPLDPGSLRLRDGRLLKFRSIRLEEDRVVVLTVDGRDSALWTELSEVCFQEEEDRWAPHWEQRAALAPNGDGRVLELHTSDHLSITSTLTRTWHRALSKDQGSDAWVHGVHPVWALDAIWVPSRQVWLRVSYPIHHFLLSRLLPSNYEHRPMIGVRRRWQRDRSVAGDPLLAAEGPFGWGIGVHSHSRLTFDLPPQAIGLRGVVGLDASAGDGGCVMARVLVGSSVKFTTKHLVGRAQESFNVDLKAGRDPDQALQVHLDVDSAHNGRPAGADPLDIRDQTNWLDPVVEFDAQWMTEQCRQLAAGQVEAWRDWTLWSPEPVSWVTEWDKLAKLPGAFTTRLEAEKQVVLARRIRRRPAQRYLILSVSNTDAKEPATLEIHSEGELLLRSTVAVHNAVAPLTVTSLESLPVDEDRDLVISISAKEPVSLRWQAVTIARQHPEFVELYNDQPHAQAVTDRRRAYTGRRCYRITPGKPLRHDFPQPMEFRYRPDAGQSRYLRFAVSTESKGLLAFRVKVRGEDKPVLYDVGQGPLTERRARRIIPQALSKRWLAVTRDLCGDLMEADVEWIEFFVPDGMGEVLIDQAYVGRGGGGAWNDLESPLAESWKVPEERQRLAEALGPRIGPGLVSLQYADGRLGEGVILDQTTVLTLGQAAPANGAAVRISTADGKQAPGEILGVDRQHNWALIQWKGKDRLPGGPPRADGAQTIPYNSAMVEIAVAGRAATTLTPAPHLARQLVSLAPAEIPRSLPGRVLVTAAGRVVGLRATTKAPRYVSLTNFGSQFAPLRKPQRVGAWPLGQGPALGIALTWTPSGAQVTEVAAAARAAGIEVGDLVVEIEGAEVRDAWTAHHAIDQKDPGQEVKLKLVRGDAEPKEVTLRLGFRP